MMIWSALAIAVSVLVSVAACGVYRRLAIRWQMMDIPNERSSHTQPTPAGGGLGIMLGLFVAVSVAAMNTPWPEEYSALLGLAGLLMILGVLDDRLGLPVMLRFAIYALACCGAIGLLLWPLPVWLAALLLVYALWLLNLFNFMDGIDGIAAGEAVFACVAAAGLTHLLGGSVAYLLFCLMLAGNCLGFLVWNWAPAKLFMGDTGSVPLGFLLAGLSLFGEIPLYCWLILLAAFISDATITLIWRALTGQRVTQAHRLHIYQRLSRHWQSHSRVVWAMTFYNVLWLAPLAMLALFQPQWALLALFLAYLPLIALWFKAVKLP